MGMQNNFRLSKTKNNILYVLSGVTLALFAGLTLFPTISESTHAEGDEPDDGIAITVNGEVDANLVLFDEGDYKIAKDTVSVSSSAAYGYELFLTTDSEAHQSIYLNDDPTSESRIAPVSGTIAEPAVLTDNTWGFAIAGQGNFDNEYDPSNPDPASRFAIIPTVDDQQAVFENNAATAEDSIDFYYGIKVEPTLEVGEYTTSAEYTATAKLPPLTAKAVLGSNKNLNFIYDRNTYTAGNTYTDNIGETTISQVYDVPSAYISYAPLWVIAGFESANFDSSFRDFKPTSTANWFYSCSKLFTIASPENLNTSNVTNMSYMFAGMGWNNNKPSNIELDLSSWDTSKVTNMDHMFDNITDYFASTIHVILNDWNVYRVDHLSQIFGFSGGGDLQINLELKNWIIGWIPIQNMFGCRGLASVGIDLSGWKVNYEAPKSLFSSSSNGVESLNLDLSGWDVGNVSSFKTDHWFNGFGNFVTNNLNINLSNWKHLDNITSMASMFQNVGSSIRRDNNTSFRLDLSGWDTSNVTDLSWMFNMAGYGATTWSIGDISGWDTSNVTNMNGMFHLAGYNATTWDVGNLRNWNVNKVVQHTDFISSSQSNIDWTKLPWSKPY